MFQNVYVRIITYVLSGFIGLIPPFALSWFAFDFVDGWIRVAVHVEGAVGALMLMLGGAVAIPWAVFKRWGVR